MTLEIVKLFHVIGDFFIFLGSFGNTDGSYNTFDVLIYLNYIKRKLLIKSAKYLFQ